MILINFYEFKKNIYIHIINKYKYYPFIYYDLYFYSYVFFFFFLKK